MKLQKKLLEIKSEVGSIIKDQKNDFANFNYAELTQIFNKITEACVNKSINVDICSVEANIEMSTLFNRPYYDFKVSVCDLESEEIIKKTFTFPSDDEGKKMKLIQATGSMYTYSQRYIFGALFSLQFEVDPDSNNSEKPGNNSKETPQNDIKWLSENAFIKIKEQINKGNLKDAQAGINQYTTDTHKMKKVYRDELTQLMTTATNKEFDQTN